MCTKKSKLINHDCLPIVMLLYIMLYIVLAYLMLFAALSNAVCLYNVSFLPMISAIAFYFHVLLTHSLFISCINLHHAQCFKSVGFSLFYVHTVVDVCVCFFLLKRPCALRRNST